MTDDDVKYAEGETYLIIQGVRARFGPRGAYTLQGFTTRKTKPDVARDEIALKLKVRLPAALFEKPLLSASITVDGEVPQMDLSPETVNTIEDLIRSQSGLDVQLTVIDPESR